LNDKIDSLSRPPTHREPGPAGGALNQLHPALLAVMVLLVAMAVYLPTFSAEFLILDDTQYVTANPYVLYPSWKKLVACFGEVLCPTTVLGYYQPLTLASLMFDRVVEGALSGGYTQTAEPFIFHFTNILLHGCNAALVFFLVLGLTRRSGPALFCGLLFAAHPLNVEVVSWVSQRKAVLATFFALLAVMSYVRFARTSRPHWYVAVIATYLAAILAKPTGLLLPLVFVLMDVWPLDRDARRRVNEKIPLLILAAIGGWIAYVSQTNAVDLTGQEGHRPLGVTALVAGHNLIFYIAKMILPIRLCPEYLMPDESVVSLGSATYLLSVICVALLVAACVWAYRRRIAFAWTLPIAFLLMIGPTLTPVRFTRTIAADRFAYTPLIIAIVLLAEFLVRRITPSASRIVRSGAPVFGAVVIALFAYLTVRQQSVWHDSYAYYNAVIARFPDAPSGHYGLGNACIGEYHRLAASDQPDSHARRIDCLEKAQDEYRRAIEADSEYCYAYYRLGHIEIIRGNLAEGISIIERGLAQPNADPEGYLFLGLARTHAGQYPQAAEPYERFLAYQPVNVEARKNLANALLRTGRAAESLPHFERLYELDPTDLDGRQNWGVALIMVGRADAAVDRLQVVVDLRAELTSRESDPSRLEQARTKLADARFTFAGALAITGADKAALAELRAAIELNPAIQSQAINHPAFSRLNDSAQWRQMFPNDGVSTSSPIDPGP
jgi:tetratricopeptide (TPR) repeat protein